MRKTVSLIVITTVLLLFVGCTSTTTSDGIPASKVSQTKKDEVYALVKGNNYLRIGEVENAINEYIKASDINPKNIDTFNKIGALYGQVGNVSKSELYFNKALALDATNAETLYNISYLLFMKKSYDMAYGYIVKIQPENFTLQILSLKFDLAYKLKDFNVAYNTFNTALTFKEPFSSDMYGDYLTILSAKGLKKEIYPFIYNQYQQFPSNETVLLMYANYFVSYSLYEKAETTLKQYGAEYGFSDAILLELSKVAYQEKNYKKSLSYISLISKEAQYAENVIREKVLIYTALGDKDKARNLQKMVSNQ